MNNARRKPAGRFYAGVAVALMVLMSRSCIAADTTSAPSIAPVAGAPTPELAEFIKKVHAQPIDNPFAKYNIHLAKKGG